MKTSKKIELQEHIDGSIDLETLVQLGAVKEYKGLFVVDTGAIYKEVHTMERGRWFAPVKQYKSLGYLHVDIDGVSNRSHRIIALLFCRGYKPELVVDHIDLNRSNNNYTNLEWVTSEENIRRAHEYYKAHPEKARKAGRPSVNVPAVLQRRVSDFKRSTPQSHPDYLERAKKWINKQVQKYGAECADYLNTKLLQ